MALQLTSASTYPAGFNNVTIRGVPITQSHPGQVYWVSNATTSLLPGQIAGSDGNPGTFNAPFSTLDYAIGRCTAGRGDIIFVKPGHAETVSSATALNLDVADIAIVGLGNGSARPTFTLDTANTATIPVSAANMAVVNCKFVANFLGIVSCFTLAAAPNFTLQSCDFSDTSAILNFKAMLTTTVSVNADNLAILSNKVLNIATTNASAAFVIAGTMTGLTVVGNRVTNTIDRANQCVFLSHGALVMTDALVKGNTLFTANSTNTSVGMFVSTSATTGSGIIADNYIRGLDVAAAIIVETAAVQYGMFNNLYIGDGTQTSGFVLPAIGTDA